MRASSASRTEKPAWLKALAKTARIVAFITMAIVTLCVLGLAWLGFSGRMAWDRTKKELLGKGEKLSYSELIAAGPSSDMNVYAHPVFRESIEQSLLESDGKTFLIDKLTSVQTPEGWKPIPLSASGDKENPDAFFDNVVVKMRRERLPGSEDESASSPQTILRVLGLVDREWQEVEKVLNRPIAIPLVTRKDFQAPLILGKVIGLAQFLSLRSRAAMAVGDSRLAAHDTRLAFRLADMMSEPVMIDEMVRWSILGFPVQSIRRGIEKHAWSEQELREFERLVLTENILETSGFALRGERGLYNQVMEQVISSGRFPPDFGIEIIDKPSTLPRVAATLYSRAFLSADLAAHNLAIQEKIDLLTKGDPAAKVQFVQPTTWQKLRAPLSFIARGSMDEFVVRAHHTQISLDQTLIAIALELFWLKHGHYPEKLSELPGESLPRGTKDRMSGTEMLYRKTPSGGFDLWSVGWNRTDDGGVQERRHREEEDWVWGK